jgi:leucyl aminopeptidase (aminopeptidase T)
VEAGVRPEDFLVERELRLEFKAGRVVAIRARQLTRG